MAEHLKKIIQDSGELLVSTMAIPYVLVTQCFRVHRYWETYGNLRKRLKAVWGEFMIFETLRKTFGIFVSAPKSSENLLTRSKLFGKVRSS